MSTPSLPNELLLEIFENLSSSSSDLFHLLLSSRSFIHVVKAILYRHITITTRAQRSGLASIRKEDSLRVRKVTIRGGGPVDTEDMKKPFADPERCKLGTGCVKDLLFGELLDISVVQTLQICDVHDEPHDAADDERYGSDFRVASNLFELSVQRHQGGGILWSGYHSEGMIPCLRRLGFSEVTNYDLDYLPWHHNDAGDPWDEQYQVPFEVSHEFETTQNWISQLQILALERVRHPADSIRFPPSFRRGNFLPLVGSNRYAIPMDSHRLENLGLEFEKQGDDLALPLALHWVYKIFLQEHSVLRHIFLGRPLEELRTAEYVETVSKLKDRGCQVHEHPEDVDDDPNSSIPPSFVRYLEQTGVLSRA